MHVCTYFYIEICARVSIPTYTDICTHSITTYIEIHLCMCILYPCTYIYVRAYHFYAYIYRIISMYVYTYMYLCSCILFGPMYVD